MSRHTFQFEPIGVIHSCYRQKFGIPRQPGLAKTAECQLEFLPPFHAAETVRGLDGFSHLWVQFIFHQTREEGWRPTIRPPKLGGKQRVGVFASRSTHRPNPIGLSVVELRRIEQSNGQLSLHLAGADLLDKTPVIDIKPYLPYSDSVPNASGGYASGPSAPVPVMFTPDCLDQCAVYENETGRPLLQLIKETLALDPRPAQLTNSRGRRHNLSLWNVTVFWESTGDTFLVSVLEIDRSSHDRTEFPSW